jgi:thiamine pyrophosphate-dependent acetolactate synthase large subunit-like protein
MEHRGGSVKVLAGAVIRSNREGKSSEGNRGYGEIRQAMVSRGIEPFGVTFDPPRFRLVAEAFGAKGQLVSEPDELVRALRAAFESEGPTLIEAAL